MMKNFIKICAALLIIANFFYAQQLSKKMGSHVNGERYKGSYKNGLKDGFGEWVHPDGDNYRGKFKAGIKRGMMTRIIVVASSNVPKKSNNKLTQRIKTKG